MRKKPRHFAVATLYNDRSPRYNGYIAFEKNVFFKYLLK